MRTISLLLMVSALMLAACVGGAAPAGVATLADPSAPASSASPSPSVDPEEAMLAFQRCMREHGVDVQVSTGGEGQAGGVTIDIQGNASATREKLDEAHRACQSLLPRGGDDAPVANQDPEFEEKMLAFARCMREHGIDFPDPQFNGGMVTIEGDADGEGGAPMDPKSNEFKAAQEACENLMPVPPGGGSTEGPVLETTP